jgi:hypothetical protein
VQSANGSNLNAEELIAFVQRWRSFKRLAQQEFRKGFESGLACDSLDSLNRSEMYKAGFSDGYWLAQNVDGRSIDVLGSWDYEE